VCGYLKAEYRGKHDRENILKAIPESERKWGKGEYIFSRNKWGSMWGGWEWYGG
jgi:hypothetical protein